MNDTLTIPPAVRLTIPAIIGMGILRDWPELGYLADAHATRPPTDEESAAYRFRYAYSPWSQWPALAEAGIAFEASPLPARPVPAPASPQCSCARCTDDQDAPAREAAAGAPPEPDESAPVLGPVAEKALANYTALHDAEDQREATAVPVTGAHTEAIPVVDAERGECG